MFCILGVICILFLGEIFDIVLVSVVLLRTALGLRETTVRGIKLSIFGFPN